MCDSINLRPQIIQTLYEIENSLRSKGLSKKDITLLLRDRIRIKGYGKQKKKMPITHIRAVLDGLKRLEKEIISNRKRYEMEVQE